MVKNLSKCLEYIKEKAESCDKGKYVGKISFQLNFGPTGFNNINTTITQCRKFDEEE